MTAIYSEASQLLPLLETLEDPSTSHSEQTDAYLSIASRLSGEEGKDFTVLVGTHFPRLCKAFKGHVSNQNSDLSNAALQALGFCVFNARIASGLTVTEIEELFSALNSVAINATDKNTCTRALWVISKQSFPPVEVGAAVPSILSTLETVLNKDGQSLVIEYEALNVVIRLLEQAPAQMTDEAVRWAKLIIPLVVHSAPKVRLRGATALEIGMPLLLQKQQEVSTLTEQLMTSKLIGELQKLFSSKNETYVLKLWPLFVKLLGKALHRSGSFINSLLQLEELGFRSGSPAVKKIAFIAWKSLIDNFALNPDILCSTKRLKLLMQPLCSIHVRTEALALTKIEVWWYLLIKLGSQLQVHFEQVCLPLIQSALSVDTSSAQATPLRTPNQSVTSSTPLHKGSFPFGSPATPKISLNSSLLASVAFPSVHLLGIEMMLHFLLGPEVTNFANQHKLNLSLEPLQHPLINNSTFFCKHAGTLLSAVQDGFIVIGREASGAVLNAVWRDMLEFVKAALDTGNKKERQGSEVLTHLMQALNNIILSNALQVEKSVSLLECTIKGLPQKVLGSAAYQVAKMDLLNGTPALFLLQLHFHVGLLEVGVTEERFFVNFETLVSYVLSGPTSPLAFSDSVLTELNQSAKSIGNEEHLWRLWSILVNPLTECINQTNEVNQGDALEHNFSAMHSALMLPINQIFPISGFPQPTMKTLLRTWSELYKAFARCAALVTTTEENVCCEELCAKILATLGSLPSDLILLERIGQVVTIIVECVNFSPYSTKFQPKKAPQTPTDWTKKKKDPLGNLTSLLKLLVKMMEFFHTLSSEESELETATPTLICIGSSIVGVLMTCIGHITLPSVIRTEFQMITRPIAIFYEKTKSESSKVYSSLSSKLDKLLGDILLCLGSRYNGTYDDDLLQSLSPLLCAIFLHKNKQIRNQAAQFWNASFAKATVLVYPEELKPVLSEVKMKTPLILPGFTFSNAAEELSGPSSDNMDNSQLETKISGIEVRSAGKRDSLLARAEELKHKGTPTRESQAKLKLDFSSPKIKPKKLLEEESVDFVFIPPETKERVLTEHQKEVLRTKRVDIPTMYNNLDASQDTTAFTQYSQSQDNSLEKPTVTEEADGKLAESKAAELVSLEKDISKEELLVKDVADTVTMDYEEQKSKMLNDSAASDTTKDIQNTSNVSNGSTSSDMVVGTPPPPLSRRQSFITLEKFDSSREKSFSPLSNTKFPQAIDILVPDSQEAMDTGDTQVGEINKIEAKPSKPEIQKRVSKRIRKSDASQIAEHKQNSSEEPSKSTDESAVKANVSNTEGIDTEDCIPDSQPQKVETKNVVEWGQIGKDIEENSLESKENTPPEPVNHSNKETSQTSNQMSLRRSSRRQSEILEGKNENPNQKRDKGKEEEKLMQKKVPQFKEKLEKANEEKVTHDVAKSTLEQGLDTNKCMKTAELKPEDLPDSSSSAGSQETARGRPRYQTRRSLQTLGTENSESDNSETREESTKRKRMSKSKSKSLDHNENDKTESSQQSLTETEAMPPVKSVDTVSQIDVDEVNNSQACEIDHKTYTISDNTILNSKTVTIETNENNITHTINEPVLNTRETNKTYDITKNSIAVFSSLQSSTTETTGGDLSISVSESNVHKPDCPLKKSKRGRRSKSCDCFSETSGKQEKSLTDLKSIQNEDKQEKTMQTTIVGSEMSSIDAQFDDSVFSGPCANSTPLLLNNEQCFFKPSVSELRSDIESEQENTILPGNLSQSQVQGETQIFVDSKALEVQEEPKVMVSEATIIEEPQTEHTDLKEYVQPASHLSNEEKPIEVNKEETGRYKTYDLEDEESIKTEEKLEVESCVEGNTEEKTLLKEETNNSSVIDKETDLIDVQDMVQENICPATDNCETPVVPESTCIEDPAEGRTDTDSPPKMKGFAALAMATDSPGGACSWSPSASPSTSILKKGIKRPQEPDSPSPINKIRRVSFANPIYQEGVADDIDRRSPIIRGNSSNGSPSRSHKGSSKHQHNTTPTKGFLSPGSRVLGIKSSKKSLISEMTKESMPSPKESVYPALMNCAIPVDVILPQITSNMWARGLGQLIRAKNIKTIGDLSTLTPTEIKTLPIRSPKVSTVKKALRVYHEQQTKTKGFDEFAVLGEIEKPLNGLDEKHPSADEEKFATDLLETSTSATDTQPSPDLLSQINALSLQLSSEHLSKYSGSQLFELHERISGMSNSIIRHLQSRWSSPPHESSS
ncbi:telomere-associated protein RIF1 [Discoglossus pictus]